MYVQGDQIRIRSVGFCRDDENPKKIPSSVGARMKTNKKPPNPHVSRLRIEPGHRVEASALVKCAIHFSSISHF